MSEWPNRSASSQKAPTHGVKVTVEYICRLLASLGVVGATPEALRQCKFNDGGVATSLRLWRALHGLVALQLASFPEGSVVAKQLGKLWEKLEANAQVQEAVIFVQHYLGLWGYPSRSPFFSLPAETSQSRELLLALGWLLSYCEVFPRGLRRRVRKIAAGVPSQALLPTPCYPEDSAEGPKARKSAEVASREAQNHIAKVAAASKQLTGAKKVEVQSKQALALYGKLRATLSALAGLQACHVQRIHALHQMQQEVHKALERSAAAEQWGPVPKLPTYSLYELQLLQHSELLKAHQAALEAYEVILQEVAEHRRHEELFWQWMGSVLDEHAKASVLEETAKANGPATFLKGLAEEGHDIGLSLEGLAGFAARLEARVASIRSAGCEQAQEGWSQAGKILQRDGWPDYSTLRQESRIGAEKSPTGQRDALPVDIEGLLEQVLEQQAEALQQDQCLAKPFLPRPPQIFAHACRPIEASARRAGGEHSRGLEVQQCTAAKEVDRLMDLALSSARVLSRTRAQNRQSLQEVATELRNDPNVMIVGFREETSKVG